VLIAHFLAIIVGETK